MTKERMDRRLVRRVTAISLHPLPPSLVIREALLGLFASHQRPSEVLRRYADYLDRMEQIGALGAIDRMMAPVHEADGFIDDYALHTYRRTCCLSPQEHDQLRAWSRATGLAQSAILRLALHEAGELPSEPIKVFGGEILADASQTKLAVLDEDDVEAG